MADVKISGLPASTTPLAGAEVLPVVQGGVTKKVAVTNLTGTTVSNAGEVGVGGDTAGVVAGVAVTSKFCVKQDGTNPVAGFVKAENTTANSGSVMFACRSRGTLAAPTIVQNGDSLWNMYLAGHDGTDLALAAEIDVQVDGTPGSNDMPGRILFKTTPDGSQTPTERMRIDSSGNVLVGITSARANAGDVQVSKGISFPATQSASTDVNTLDDYEEGTWTPAVTTNNGTATGYSNISGSYTKVGRSITIQGSITPTGGTFAGYVQLSGLPFVPATNGVGAFVNSANYIAGEFGIGAALTNNLNVYIMNLVISVGNVMSFTITYNTY